MSMQALREVAKAMVAPGKGILAADESTGTAAKRFGPLGIPNTEEMRRAYREMLFTTPRLGDAISGVILFDETIRQSHRDGTPFTQILERAGVIPGIKLDQGAKPMALAPGETDTEGLDGLGERAKAYFAMGARFAKWRAVIDIGASIPTIRAIEANAHGLARYAAICQANGLVPIVEPEVLMDGDHTIETSFRVHELVLRTVFEQLDRAGVEFESMILKPSMVIPGKKCTAQRSVQDVAAATVVVLKRYVPSAVAGIAFLSGGQADDIATAHLDAMNRILGAHAPWPLTFSYGRALQAASIAAWHGKDENVAAGQAAFAKRAMLNGAAARGEYRAEQEHEALAAR